MIRKAAPLTAENAPKRCINDPQKYCSEHAEMVRTRAVGVALFRVIGWAIPLVLIILTGTIGFLFNNIHSVEAKNNEIYQTVLSIEFNLRRLLDDNEIEYIEP